MHRKLCVCICLVLVAGFSSVCSAQNQKKTINKPTIPTTGATATSKGDLRPALAKLRSQNKLVQGKNLVHSQGGNQTFKLFAVVDSGKVTQWQAVDGAGKNLPTQMKSVAQAEGGVTCNICVIMPDGKSRCYEISCSDAPKPKPKASTR